MGATEVFELFAKLKLDSSEFNSGLSKAKSAASGIGSTIGGAFKTAMAVGSVAMGAATTAVSMFAKTAISAGLSFDTAMGEVAATAGKTEQQMAEMTGSVETDFGHFEGTLRDFAKFMGKNTAFSASQAAEALNYMALAGLNTQQSMEMLPKVLDMASAGAMDLGRASDMITDISSAVGLSLAGIEDPELLKEYSDRIGGMVDEFAKAAATGNTTVEMLGDAFLTVGGLAKEVNGGFIQMSDGSSAAVDNLQQLEIAFTAMANAGIKGSEAGTHMRNILLKLANPTKGGQEAFDKMGISIYDANGNMKALNVLFEEMNASLSQMTQADKLNAIGEIFNARDTASAEALMAAVAQDWDRIGEAILDAEGSAHQMAETKLDNLQGDVTKFKSAMEGLRISISDGLTPTLRTFVQLGTEGISKIAEAFEKNDFSGAMDVVGDVLNKGISMIFDKVDMFVEAGATILGAVAKGLVQNLPKLIEAGKNLLMDFVSRIDTSTVANAITGFVDTIASMLGDSSAMQKLSSTGTKLLFAILEGWLNSKAIIYDTATNLLEGLANGLIEAIPQALPGMLDAIRNLLSSLISNAGRIIEIIKQITPVLIESAIQIITTLADGLIEALPVLIPAIVDVILYIAEQLLAPENLSALLDVALKIITQLAWALVQAIPRLLEGAVQVIIGLCEFLTNPVNRARIIETALNIIIALATGLINAVPVLLAEIPNIVISIFTSFVDAIFHTNWIEVGANIITGIIQGLWEGFKSLVGTIGDICDRMTNRIMDFFGIASPSKLMRDKVGKNLALGIAEGLEDGTSNVERAMEDVMGAASGNISGTVTTRETEMDINHTGTIRIEGVNNQGEFVAASEYVIEEILTNILKREARLA